MTSDDVTRQQADALKKKFRPMLRYLGTLKMRMNRRGFLQDDPLMIAVCRAEAAIHELSVLTHYLSCGTTGSGGYPPPVNFPAPDATQRRPNQQQ
jgi:hypothetical protein